MKSKGERERYIQINEDFQRIKRRDKKAFFSEQYIKLEEKKTTTTKVERLEISSGKWKISRERFTQRWA